MNLDEWLAEFRQLNVNLAELIRLLQDPQIARLNEILGDLRFLLGKVTGYQVGGEEEK